MRLCYPIRLILIHISILLCNIASSAYAANTVTLGTTFGFSGGNVVVTMNLDNDIAIAGVQFTIRDTPSNVALVSVTKTSRLSAFSTPDFNDLADLGVAKLLGFSFGGQVASGTGNILNLTFKIADNTAPGDILLTFDQVVLSTPGAVTVESTGIPGVIKVLDPVALTPHPAGQPINKFDQTARAIDQDLFRFGMTTPAYPFRLSSLTFDIGLAQLGSSNLTDMRLFEDTNGDGTPDGSALFSNISVDQSHITASGLNVLLPAQTTRYYILKGTVALNRVADQLSLSIPSTGVGGNIEDAVIGTISAKTNGTVANAVHTATGFTGDVSFDLKRNIVDVVKIVGVLLGHITLDGDTSFYDINQDTQVDITDAVALIQQILNGESTP